MNKELQLVRNEMGALYFKWEGGGEIPDVLKGTYTSHAAAEKQLALWEAAKPRGSRRGGSDGASKG